VGALGFRQQPVGAFLVATLFCVKRLLCQCAC
jgi:hypothetical protein